MVTQFTKNKTKQKNKQTKKKNGRIVDIAVPADHRVKLKESEKKDKYLDFSRDLKTKQNKKTPQKLWNMKETVIPVVAGALGTVTKGLVQGLEDLEIGGRAET